MVSALFFLLFDLLLGGYFVQSLLIADFFANITKLFEIQSC